MPDNINFGEEPTEEVVEEKVEEVTGEQQIEDAFKEFDKQEEVVEEDEIPEGSLHGKTDGSEQVDMDQPTQDRFNRIYRQMKTAKDSVARQEEDIKLMREHNNALEERLNKRDAERTKIQADHTMANLEFQYAQALDEGDNTKVAAINRQMQQAAVTQNTPEPAVQPAQPQEQSGKTFSPQDTQYIMEWQNEVSDDGYFERPWIQQNHPEFDRAQQLISTYENAQGWENATVQQVLYQVDVDMRNELGQNEPEGINNNQQQAKRSQVAAVSTSDTSYRPESNRTGANSLTADEKRVARMILSDMNPQKAYEMYAAQKED